MGFNSGFKGLISFHATINLHEDNSLSLTAYNMHKRFLHMQDGLAVKLWAYCIRKLAIEIGTDLRDIVTNVSLNFHERVCRNHR